MSSVRFAFDDHAGEVRRLLATSRNIRVSSPYWNFNGIEAILAERASDGASVQVLCDLMSDACNPKLIERLLKQGIEVRHQDRLHAKIYLGDAQALVTSANATAPGMGTATRPNIEAGVIIGDESVIPNIVTWFEGAWTDAQPITPLLMAMARDVWMKARQIPPVSKTDVLQNVYFLLTPDWTREPDWNEKEFEELLERIQSDYQDSDRKDDISTISMSSQTLRTARRRNIYIEIVIWKKQCRLDDDVYKFIGEAYDNDGKQLFWKGDPQYICRQLSRRRSKALVEQAGGKEVVERRAMEVYNNEMTVAQRGESFAVNWIAFTGKDAPDDAQSAAI